ncbi:MULTISPECIES: ABC-2 transporter permease [Streptomyces]|uniref:DUF3533 domain-containing protein n=1 Tax=Streptomyces koyangensis TaxID=188770 RepID=A0A385DJK5_9ACTN|nr:MULTISPECIES: DUF3533 domain-containing protein [Streptomyces]AXQ57961.1 DUF3533 domain-containing protein [Streptomyces koyangensis]PKR42162.1 DUF3533 domain-containing protein [Streptomyces sp. EAG2]WTD01948.1 DUF3533 domain-containing protein [Streptomyces albidoflavus]
MSHSAGPATPRGLAAELRDAVTPRTTLLVLGALALQILFIASYVGALHDPKPHHVPFGVAAPGPAGQGEELVSRLNALSGDPLDARKVADEAEARHQILERKLDGALVVDPEGTGRLLVASGGGTVLATSLERIITETEAAEGRQVRTVDIAPASREDFDGLSSFYLAVGWSVGGYLTASLLALSAGERPANGRRAVIRLACMALYSIAGGFGGAVVVGPVLGALPGSLWGMWGLGSLVVFSVGALTLALEAWTGLAGIGVAVLIVVVGGNPSAGGAFPLPMLPPFWEAIGPALQPGAGTWGARSIAYFDGRALTGPLLVLAAWAAGGILVTLAAGLYSGSRQRSRGLPR